MGGVTSELAGTSTGSRRPWRRALTAPLRIDEREVSVARRGFRIDTPAARERIEEVGRSFLRGYHAALEEADVGSLGVRLDRVAPEFRGFGHEGAAMALALLDTLAPWRRRLAAFLAGPGEPQLHIATVGAGWILGRLPLAPRSVLRRLDPVLGWLAVDGYGFHEGFFHWPRSITRQEVPRKVSGYARRAFDQGLGRSLWFVQGADPLRVAESIARFPAARHDDLWAGCGLAAAYAGGCEPAALAMLPALAGRSSPMLRQGATFAAVAREHGRNPAAHTELASQVLCGRGTPELAAVAEETGRDLPADGAEPAFEVWRCRIQSRLAAGDALR
jgi:hypothetical protein